MMIKTDSGIALGDPLNLIFNGAKVTSLDPDVRAVRARCCGETTTLRDPQPRMLDELVTSFGKGAAEYECFKAPRVVY